MDCTDIEWDAAKRRGNLAKHGLDFADALGVLEDPCLLLPERTSGEEYRAMAIGRLADVHVCLIFTLRGTVLRVISMRKARRDERLHHDQAFGH